MSEQLTQRQKDIIETSRMLLKEEFDEQIKAAEKRGAQRMLDILKCKKPFVDNGSFTTICDHCMESMKIWEEWEKLSGK